MRNKKFFVLIIIIFIGGIIDTGKQWMSLADTKKSIEKLNATQKPVSDEIKNQPMMSVQKEYAMNHILMLIESSGLSSQFISAMEEVDNGQPMDNFDLILLGNFQQITQFFKIISSQCLPFFIDRVELNHSIENWRLRIRVRILRYCMKSENVVFSPAFSIRQLKMAGYLQYKNHLSAIILLPDREAKEISLGDVLGREQAKVIFIDENKVLVETNKTIVSIIK